MSGQTQGAPSSGKGSGCIKSCLTVFAVFIGFIFVAILIGHFSGPSYTSYNLDVINNGDREATITISDAKDPITIAPKSVKVVKVDGQDEGKAKEERTFTIKAGDQTDTVKSKVDYLGHTVVDVTGDSIVVAADCGAMYGGGDKYKLEDIKILKVFTHPARVYTVSTFDKDKMTWDFIPKFGVGEPLPDKLEVSAGHTGPPVAVRLVVVPEEVVDDPRALAKEVSK